MLLGFKTELKLNNQQRTELLQHCGVSRHSWNWGLALTKQILDHNKANPNEKIKFPTAIDLHKWLVALVKSENPWYYQCAKSTPQEALRALREAWKRCFNKISGVPKFKKKGQHDSFTLEGCIKVIASNKIQVPKLGILKTYENIPQIKPKSVTISREANRWFISFRFDQQPEFPKVEETWFFPTVGVDLGIKNLATLSTGEVIEGAKSYKMYEAKLARMQSLSRNKVKGSSNWRKAQLEIASLHRTIANIRKDTLHKLTTLLAKNHGLVVIEDLNVSGMMANHKLAKAIADMGFYEFRRQLTYKCEFFGTKLVVASRWFPSSKTCSGCGHKKETLKLDERVFHCEHCRLIIDRDLNAAINLKNYSYSTVS